ncbi:hypothetical protein FB382_003724 [Nocardioides ginsengisegetis]|uniref:Uncharacterized protein n=1 Tax=Nocardioides ginsengisegetis TaxID=661491 RepID=A0A7W3J362_9ACTN|nr:hypothetical protein [Nocardioides ginsengisegetis]MBA8805433.1 hypothetical protein [Nocardioides ginsengisegetis]
MTTSTSKYDGWLAWLIVAAIGVVGLGVSLWGDEGRSRYLALGIWGFQIVAALSRSYRAKRLDQMAERSDSDSTG